MRILAIDTETTGLIKKDSPIPCICQYSSVSWDTEKNILTGITNKHVKPYYDLDRPDIDWKVLKKISGVTPQILLDNGVDIISLYNDIMLEITYSDLIIGHNLKYDMEILCRNFANLGDATLYNTFMRGPGKFTNTYEDCTFDTMVKTVEMCKLPHKQPQKYDTGTPYKYPKLSELYQFLFGTAFDNAHDSLYDCISTMKCFLAIKGFDYVKFSDDITNYLK